MMHFMVQEVVDCWLDVDGLQEDYDYPDNDLEYVSDNIDLDSACYFNQDEKVDLGIAVLKKHLPQ